MRSALIVLLAVVLLVPGLVPVFGGGAAETEEETVLRVLQPGIDQPGLGDATERVVELFEAANPGVRVQLESVGWGDAYQKITTDILSGDAADVIYGGTRWIPAFAAMGGLLELTDMVPAAKVATFPDGIMQAQYFGGELYGLPVAFSTKSLYYRTDLIDSPPTTWEELLETATAITEEHDGVYGIGIPGAAHVGTVQHFHKFLWQAGGNFFNEDGMVALETPEAEEALAMYTGLFTDYNVAPNPIEFNREELPTLFGEGRIAMHINGPWARAIMDREPDNPDVPYATAILPAHERSGGLQGGDSVVVWSGTDHPELAAEFIQFWTSFDVHTEYIRTHGLVPMVDGQADLPDFADDFWASYVAMIDDGFPEAQPLAWEPFQGIITDMIQSVLLGESDVPSALAWAADEIRDQELQPADAR